MSDRESCGRSLEWLQAIASLVAVVVAAGAVIFTMTFETQKFLAFDPNAVEALCSPMYELVADDGVVDEGEQFLCDALGTLPPPREVRREFVRLLIEHPEQEQAILASYLVIYPQGRKWISELAAAATGG